MKEPGTKQSRHLAAVWLADIVGYSPLAASNEDRALRLVEKFQREATSAVERHGGRVVKFLGDAALAEFSSTAEAALAAADLRDGLAPDTELRVGLHVGDILRTADGDILGDGVNVAARLQTAAAAGQILVSEQAWQQLRHREGFEFVAGGSRQLKGQAGRSKTWEMVGVPKVGDSGVSVRPTLASTSRLAAPFRYPARALRKLDNATHGRSTRVAWLALVVVTVGGLWLGLSQVMDLGRFTAGDRLAATADEGPDPTRIAVLYFDDHSQGGELGYLADGLTEALIHELAQVEALEVISRNGVKPFQHAAVPLDSIVQTLRVGSVVEGSVAQSGDRLRVTVQLIDGASGAHLESRVIEEREGDLFRLQDAVVSEVGIVLRQSLGREINLRALRHSTNSNEAYELVLRANELRGNFNLSARYAVDGVAARRAYLEADSLLRMAEAMDPSWVDPTLQRGIWARLLAQVEGNLPGQYDPIQTKAALELAEKALHIAPNDARVLELQGSLLFATARNLSGTERREVLDRAAGALRQATAQDPKLAQAWLSLSVLQLETGNFAEARIAAQSALRADAFLEEGPAVLHQIYYSAVQDGPTDEARRACDEGRQRYPKQDEFISCQLFLLASFPSVSPDLDRGWALADSLIAAVPAQSRETFRAFGTMLLAQIAARAGMADSARALIRSSRGDSVVDWLAYNEAHARLHLGERDEAVKLLSAFLASQPDTALVARDWWFESLRSDPRFQTVVNGGQ